MNIQTEKTKAAGTGNAGSQEKQGSRSTLRRPSFWSSLGAHRLKRGALLYWAGLFTLSAAVVHCIAVLKAWPPSALLGVLLGVLLVMLVLVQAAVAVTAMAVPARRLLLIAGLIELAGILLWLAAHTVGLPDGVALWRAETLEVPDLYLPVVEGITGGFFLCLCARTREAAPRVWRITFGILPHLLYAGLLVWLALKSVAIVVFFLVPGVFLSLQYFFLPVVGLLAVFLILRVGIRPLRLKTQGAWRATFIVLPALLLFGFVTWGGGVSAVATAWLSSSSAVSVPAGQTATLTYCNSSSGSPLAMDISEPAARAIRPAPVAFYIHGGETLIGSRIVDDGSLDGMYFTQLRSDLLARGFVVGAIDYGLVPLYNIGEQVKDAKCAVRFLRAHARELGIDPQRIGVYGPSQGGYLSAMLGTVGPEAGLDVGQYTNQSSSVQAVVDMWGPMDISNFSGSPGWASLLVGHAPTGQLRNSSPLYHVKPGDPPFLIMHGTDDWFIAPHHSQDMARALQAAGVPVTLVMIQHDSHGLAMPTSGQIEQPAPSVLVQMIVDFFARTLAA